MKFYAKKINNIFLGVSKYKFFFTLPSARGKKSVKNGIWKIGGRIRKQRREVIPIGLIAWLAAPVFKTIFERARVRRQRGKGVGSTIAKNGINLGAKFLSSKIGKKNNKQNN